ncbi:MAG TPA: hypothetical protein VGJ15_07175, partial [Pirellulales bacterium]
DAVIASVVKLAPARQQQFPNGGLTDPIAMKFEVIPPVKPAPKQPIFRRCDLYFVAKGKVDWVADPAFIQQQLKGKNVKNGFFTPAEIAARNLKVVNNNNVQERYVHVILELIDIVVLSASARAMETKENDSVIVAFMVDPRLESDQAYPNLWQLILRGAGGVRKLGDTHPYQGMAAYAKITALAAQPDRVFVEYHVAYEEPNGWFNGGEALRSKLPNEYETDSRQFRRDLVDFGKKQAAAGANPPAAGANPAAAAGANPPTAGGAAPDVAAPADAKKDAAKKADDKAKGSGK